MRNSACAKRGGRMVTVVLIRGLSSSTSPPLIVSMFASSTLARECMSGGCPGGHSRVPARTDRASASQDSPWPSMPAVAAGRRRAMPERVRPGPAVSCCAWSWRPWRAPPRSLTHWGAPRLAQRAWRPLVAAPLTLILVEGSLHVVYHDNTVLVLSREILTKPRAALYNSPT